MYASQKKVQTGAAFAKHGQAHWQRYHRYIVQAVAYGAIEHEC